MSRALTGFLIRLVAYAFALTLVSRVTEYEWVRHALDGSITLQPLHDFGITALVVAPLVLAFFGGRLTALGVFAGALLAGAALTAPFAFAHFGGG